MGLREIVRELAWSTDIVVGAWPLERVNGAPLDVIAVHVKIDALRSSNRDETSAIPRCWPCLLPKRGLPAPDLPPSRQVRDDYAEGRRREVTGSPDFWLGGEEFFCPSLDLDHDAEGDLKASFDTNGLNRFISRVREFEASQGDQQ